VLDPRDMRFVPVRAACSEMTREDESAVGGFGAKGIVEARFEEDMAAVDS